MRGVDFAIAAAVASIAAGITLALLGPSFALGDADAHEHVGFARVAEQRFVPPQPERTPEPVPMIVEDAPAMSAEEAPAPLDSLPGGWLEAEGDEADTLHFEGEPEAYWDEPEAAPEEAHADVVSFEAMDPDVFKEAGVVVAGDARYTWYSSREDGGEIDVYCEADADGIFRDADGYIVVASGDMEMGEVVETPLGDGKVYDRCPTSGVVDVYTDWSDL